MSNIVIALTGASGIAYGLRLINYVHILKKKYNEVYVIYSENAARVARIEEGVDLTEYLTSASVDAIFSNKDLDASIASSSRLVNSDMVVVPASLNTIAKIANGIQDNLITRVACNTLRLRGKLVVVVRETPLSAIDLRNLYKLALAGAVILPASPAFYPKPRDISDILDFIVGKVLDVLGINHELYRRWSVTKS